MIIKFRRILALSLVFTLMFTTICFAADKQKEFRFSDLDVIITVPSGLYTATRATTSSDPVIEMLELSDAAELRASLESNFIYLEVFPQDKSYEILLQGFSNADEVKDFNDLSDEEIIKYANEQSLNNNASFEIQTINNVKYLVTKTFVQEALNKVYATKYTTIKNKKTITLILQSKEEQNGTMKEQFDSMLNSIKFEKVDASLSENPFFTEIFNSVAAYLIFFAILGIILFFVVRVDKKNKALRK